MAYLARELPQAHIHGLTGVSQRAWNAAAHQLERQVPRLSDGQVVVGMARIVAMLHDDETQLLLPRMPIYPFEARWIGAGVYFIGVPTADRELLGARLLAVDGRPIRKVIAALRGVIDYQDPGEARAIEVARALGSSQPGYINDAALMHWLGVTRSVTAATFTVRTARGKLRSVKMTAVSSRGPSLPQMAYVPTPLYRQRASDPYWLRILAGQKVVYLKYNSCLSDHGFQRLAKQALAVLRTHPAYRLVIDLRDNAGGDSRPFQALVKGILAEPAIDRRGRIFGLINELTASSASEDAYDLGSGTNALLIGQPVEDPIDEFGNDDRILRMPHSGVPVVVTTAVINPGKIRFGIPDIPVAPTLADWLTGRDPVLSTALAYGRKAPG